MSTSNKKATKVAEIVRLQDAIYDATKATDHHTAASDVNYSMLVDEYLTFLLHFVGTSGFEWTEQRLTKMDRFCEVTTNIRTPEALMKIPEDMIPPVAVREMLLGDEDGPWLHIVGSTRIRDFLDKYPFLITRIAGA